MQEVDVAAKEIEPGNTSSNVPRKASELRAFKDLKGHIFTIGSGNKGKDGNMLCTSKEKMATYIGTKYGDDTAKSIKCSWSLPTHQQLR